MPDIVPRICADTQCEPRWETTSWSECTTSCGPGFQSRTAHCWLKIEAGVDSTILPEKCRGEIRPQTMRKCENRPCSSPWMTSEWSFCSAECGSTSVRIRHVECRSPFCVGEMPSTHEICTNECTYKWMRFPWSQCSDKCGGRTYRKVLCQSSEGQQVADSFCTDKKPKTSRRCGRNCAPFWQIGEWSICSQTCSSADQLALSYRSVKCVSTDHRGRFRPGNHCDGPRPDKEMECDVPACPISWVFSQWSKCSVSCGTGVITRQVSCSKIGKCSGPIPDVSKTCELGSCPHMKINCVDVPGINCPVVKKYGYCSNATLKARCCETCSE